MENENVQDILAYAWNGDMENLKSVIDAEMQARVAVEVDNMTAEVAQGIFYPDVPEVDQELESDLTSDEEVTDEVV
jgi:hypothetical protein